MAKEVEKDGAMPTVVALTADQLVEVLETVGQSNAEAMRASLRKDNPNYNEKSVFTHPEGEKAHPKEKLRRKSYFCSARLREDQLTPTEIALLNRFTANKDAREGRWTARITRSGTDETLLIDVPIKSIDDRMSLPSGLTLILRELLEGEDSVNVDSMAEKVEQLQNRIAQLERGRPAQATA